MYTGKAQSSQKEIQAILFDLDGTLMATANDLSHALNQLLTAKGKHHLPIRDIEKQASNGAKAILQLGFPMDDSHPDFASLYQQYLSIYLHRLETQCTTPFYDGIEVLLQHLETQDIPWGIVTNKFRHLTLALLNWHHLVPRCAIIVCPEDVSQKKPSPEPLLKACTLINCNPEHCIYIGDHQRDIIAGQRAGMLTVAATYGYLEEYVTPETWNATFIANQPADILTWLQGNQWKLSALNRKHS